MTVLCADIANDSTHLGLVEETGGRETGGRPRVTARWRVATVERRTPDEWAVLVAGLLGPEQAAAVRGVSLCATVPSVLAAWREMLRRYFAGSPVVVVGPGIRTGVPVLMDNPREVGADRIVHAVAAVAHYGGPAIVVALGGTATTFDAVDGRGRYVGGAIAPGVEVSQQALTRRGAQLRDVELVPPRAVIAKNTVEALQSGMVFGFASLVDGVVTRMAEELGATDGSPLTVVATGPLAPLVVTECRRVTDHDPELTLHGLRLVYARNAA